MPTIKRRFVFDRSSGEVVELTADTRRKPVQAKYGYASEAMAVDPEDVPKAQAILQQHGVQTEYDRAGRPVIRSKGHRKAHAEALGFYDRNGGFGDPQARNR